MALAGISTVYWNGSALRRENDTMAATAHSDLSNAETEVVDLASELIRVDTTNTGTPPP